MDYRTRVLARRDDNGMYSEENWYWREPRSDKEAQMGIEDLGFDEPEVIALTRTERRIRARMDDPKKRMFDIWKRMMWRCGKC